MSADLQTEVDELRRLVRLKDEQLDALTVAARAVTATFDKHSDELLTLSLMGGSNRVHFNIGAAVAALTEMIDSRAEKPTAEPAWQYKVGG